MGKTNLAVLPKDEIIRRWRFRCIHGHSGIEHQSCYFKKQGVTERIGFFDLETSNLKATFGYVLSFCIKQPKGKIIKRVLTSDEVRGGILDRNLCSDFIKAIQQFDRLIGYYSVRFDAPFIRTRCVSWGLDFPKYGELKHKDLYDIVRNKFSLHSNRLSAACEFFGIPAKGHRLNPKVWNRAMAGSQRDLNYILTHNIEDVISTELLWDKVCCYSKINNTSI